MQTSLAFTLGTMKQLGSITFSNQGVYLITGNMNFQYVTTAGTITYNMVYSSSVASGSGTTGSNSNCQIKPPLISTVMNSYYGYQGGLFALAKPAARPLLDC